MQHIDGRWGEVIEESNDKGPYKIVRVQSEGHEFEAIIVEAYGMQASPVKGGQIFILPFNADNGQAMAMVLPPPAKRVDEQKPGEVSIKQHKSGNRRYMDNDGDTQEATKRDFSIKTKRHHTIDTEGICYINCGASPAGPKNMLEA